LENNNKGKLRIIVKHLPLTQLEGHEFSLLAAQSVQAAGKMGKFEEMHYSLLEMNPINRDSIIGRAESLGLNKDEFVKYMDSEEIRNEVNKDMQMAQNLKVQGTPTIFLNGIRLDLQKKDLNTEVLIEVNKAYPVN
ncbi:hypothetical protein EBU91_05025, partial [bacterium]|nr:hypothetical protein [bacterium]